MRRILLFSLTVCLAAVPLSVSADEKTDTPQHNSDWETYAPRDEIRPKFKVQAEEKPGGRTFLVISADDRAGQHGAWVQTVPIKGGRYYRFSALRRTAGVDVPRRSAVVKLTWQDGKGKLVRGKDDLARPEFPRDKGVQGGWSVVADTYWVPEGATRARIELHLRWAKNGSVRWTKVSLTKTEKPKGRIVRLASVHYRPQGGKTAAENCRLFAPLILEAAEKEADLICLPECLTLYGNGLKYADVAESVPGPSTKYFGTLAQKYDVYIVAGLMERSKNVIYNTAALIGPDGKLLGKYRKVCLPREEIEGGVTPGHNYPVFDTRFGKLGMMICWDVHFPEVARNLSNQGAEVIAMPIWGGNPALAKARAIENQVYLVTSTYTDPNRDWMKTAVYDYEGNMLSVGKDWGTVIVSEVDLDQRKHWKFLGDFKARIARERPIEGFRD